jgi:putative transposase
MEAEYNHLNHTTWECKYHVVFTPKYRKKVLFGKIKRQLGQVFHDLARRKECQIEEGHLMPDHVHMLISIPPKYSVAQIIGYMKGKRGRVQYGSRRMSNARCGIFLATSSGPAVASSRPSVGTRK